MFAAKLKKNDLIIPIAAALVAAIVFSVFLFGGGEKAGKLIVTRAGSADVEEYPLSVDAEYVFTGNGYTLHVRILDGGVCVESSDCPGCDCARTGRITKPGRSIVCVPAGLVFSVVGEEDKSDADADAVAG